MGRFSDASYQLLLRSGVFGGHPRAPAQGAQPPVNPHYLHRPDRLVPRFGGFLLLRSLAFLLRLYVPFYSFFYATGDSKLWSIAKLAACLIDRELLISTE